MKDTGSEGTETTKGHRVETRGRAVSLTPEPSSSPSIHGTIHAGAQSTDASSGGWALGVLWRQVWAWVRTLHQAVLPSLG